MTVKELQNGYIPNCSCGGNNWVLITHGMLISSEYHKDEFELTHEISENKNIYGFLCYKCMNKIIQINSKRLEEMSFQDALKHKKDYDTALDPQLDMQESKIFI